MNDAFFVLFHQCPYGDDQKSIVPWSEPSIQIILQVFISFLDAIFSFLIKLKLSKLNYLYLLQYDFFLKLDLFLKHCTVLTNPLFNFQLNE